MRCRSCLSNTIFHVVHKRSVGHFVSGGGGGGGSGGAKQDDE